MKTATFFSLAFVIVLAGCGHEPLGKANLNEPEKMNQPILVKTTTLSGFDPEGEPEVREMSDGSLMVVFNFMPPSYAEDEEEKYADFEKQMERAVGVPVFRDDRELFLIRKPRSDTAEKLKAFLEGYRESD